MSLREELLSRFHQAQTLVRYDQLDTLKAPVLETSEKTAPAGLILLTALSNTQNVPKPISAYANRHQDRYVANLSSPAAFEANAIQI